ncbi:MAG: hypothetical protein M0R37_12965 [Bacteroidales bacterium]|nr:hypothetical protein [Bacteroidales bacterium]
MEKQIKGQNQIETLQILQDNADSIEEVGYTRFFSEEELAEKKDLLADRSIELNNIDEEKSDVVAGYKAKMRPIREDISKLLTDIKQKSEYVNDKCYKFVDQETREVGYYDKNGNLVQTRRAKPEELQGNIFKMKTGTHD